MTRSLYSLEDSDPGQDKAALSGQARAQRYDRRSQVSDALQWKLVLRKPRGYPNSKNRLCVETYAQDTSVREFVDGDPPTRR